MREDELATAVVEQFEAGFDDPEIRLERPYNHYGTRGVVDVYARTAPPERVSYLAELKADAAVRMASGANEILRQYRRTERYFYRDDAHDLRTALARDGPGVHLLLPFAPTTRCVEHVFEHRSSYASVDPDLAIDGVPAARKVAFPVNLDAAPAGGSASARSTTAPTPGRRPSWRSSPKDRGWRTRSGTPTSEPTPTPETSARPWGRRPCHSSASGSSAAIASSNASRVASASGSSGYAARSAETDPLASSTRRQSAAHVG